MPPTQGRAWRLLRSELNSVDDALALLNAATPEEIMAGRALDGGRECDNSRGSGPVPGRTGTSQGIRPGRRIRRRPGEDGNRGTEQGGPRGRTRRHRTTRLPRRRAHPLALYESPVA